MFQVGEQSGQLPAEVAVQIADQLPLGIDVMAVVVVQSGSAPEQDRPEASPPSDRIDRPRCAGSAEADIRSVRDGNWAH